MPETNLKSRFSAWVALMGFSAVCLGELCYYVAFRWRPYFDLEMTTKWNLAVMSISMVTSLLAVVAHFVAYKKFVGEAFEGALILINSVFWIAGLYTIMDESHPGSNMYFMSWAAAVVSLFLFAHYAQSVWLPVNHSSTSQKLHMWLFLTVASVVVVASSSRFLSSSWCGPACMINKYAFVLGAVGTLLGLVAMCLVVFGKFDLPLETWASAMAMLLYIGGVFSITFPYGPASWHGLDRLDPMTNLYFGTLFGFGISLFLASQCIHELYLVEPGQAGTGNSLGESEAALPESAPPVAVHEAVHKQTLVPEV